MKFAVNCSVAYRIQTLHSLGQVAAVVTMKFSYDLQALRLFNSCSGDHLSIMNV